MSQNYPERWVGRGITVAWPALSLNSTPIDFYLWGTIGNIVYNTTVDIREGIVGANHCCTRNCQEKG